MKFIVNDDVVLSQPLEGPLSAYIAAFDLSRKRGAGLLTEHPPTPEMAMLRERRREPSRERDVPQSSTLWLPHVPVPIGLTHAELTFRQIAVGPLERDHLSAPQPRIATQQHDQLRPPIDRPGDLDEPFVLIDIVKPISSSG
jgi:hypothetical protein